MGKNAVHEYFRTKDEVTLRLEELKKRYLCVDYVCLLGTKKFLNGSRKFEYELVWSPSAPAPKKPVKQHTWRRKIK